MLYLCPRALVVVATAAVCVVPIAAAPFQFAPRRNFLPLNDDSPRASDGLVFDRRHELDSSIVTRSLAGPDKDKNGPKIEGMPLRFDDVETPEASKTINVIMPHCSGAIRPQPSSGTPIFPRMFNLNVNKSKGTKEHASPEATSQYTSAAPSQTPHVDAIVWSGSGIALE